MHELEDALSEEKIFSKHVNEENQQLQQQNQKLQAENRELREQNEQFRFYLTKSLILYKKMKERYTFFTQQYAEGGGEVVQLAREKRREREEEGRGGEGGEIGGGVRGFLSNSLVSLWAYPEGEWEEDRKGFEKKEMVEEDSQQEKKEQQEQDQEQEQEKQQEDQPPQNQEPPKKQEQPQEESPQQPPPQQNQEEVIFDWGQFAGQMVGNAAQHLGPALERAKNALIIEEFVLSDEAIAVIESLRSMANESYDKEEKAHEKMLIVLWGALRPEELLDGVVCDQWRTLGFQKSDPSTDFRGMGLLGLHCLIYVANIYSVPTLAVLEKHQNITTEGGSFPWACGGINVCAMLFDLFKMKEKEFGGGEVTEEMRVFVELLNENTKTFEELFCLSFFILSDRWDEVGAKYMDFPHVMDYTRNTITSILRSKPATIKQCFEIGGISLS